MANELQFSGVPDETAIAGADLTATVGLGIKFTAGLAVKATAGAYRGVQITKGNTGEPVTYRMYGHARIILGGTVVKDDRLTTDANGKFVKLTPGAVSTYSDMAGYAREGGGANDEISAMLIPPVPVGSA